MSGSAEQKQSGTSSNVTTPWAPQAAALTNAFGKADTALGTASKAVAPTDFTAQMTPDQLTNFHSMIGYGGDGSAPAAQTAAGATLTSAGTTGTTGALAGLASYDPTTANNADSLIGDANKYVAGQDIPGAVRAAMQSANETARDITMPAISQNAATSGNVNNSRAGLAEGIVQRGLGEQAGNLSATLNNKAYTDGLGIASNSANSNNSAILDALKARGAIGTTAVNSGVNATGQAIAGTGALFDIAGKGGVGEQANEQAKLDNASQQYSSKTSAPFDALKQYMQIIGANNWGSSSSGQSTSTTTSTPSAWQVAGGLMGGAGSLMGGGGLGRLFTPSAPTWSTGVGNGAGGHAFPIY